MSNYDNFLRHVEARGARALDALYVNGTRFEAHKVEMRGHGSSVRAVYHADNGDRIILSFGPIGGEVGVTGYKATIDGREISENFTFRPLDVSRSMRRVQEAIEAKLQGKRSELELPTLSGVTLASEETLAVTHNARQKSRINEI